MAKKEQKRTCIVTRDLMNCDEMIRFVIAPQGEVVVDLKEKLPGRGVWVTNSRQVIQSAIDRKLFAAGFKQKVSVSTDILQAIEKLMLAKISNGLSMAKKSGLVITGFAKVSALARAGDVKILLHASDGRDDGVAKIRSALVSCQSNDGYKKGLPQIFDRLGSAQLDVALGMSNSVHVALTQGGATRSLKKQITRLENYCS